MPYEKYKQYTMAIACGKYKPKRNEPKIWFESIETFCQVLSTKNVELLKLIDEKKPQSIRELAEISGRQVSNLSRTLKTFNKYGIVDIIENKKAKMPVAKTTSFNIEYGKKYPSFLFDDV
jgi:predicted transcriptional regulator